MNKAGVRSWAALLLVAISLSLIAVIAQAKDAGPPGDDLYMFADVCNSPWSMDTYGARRIRLYGSGGIKVTNQLIPDRIDRYSVCIDGSPIGSGSGTGGQSLGLKASNIEGDFNASASSAYFVSRSANCTLPTATGVAGKEIVVSNKGGKITYTTTSGETISGNPSGALTNSTPYKVDRFISDGKNWYRE